ncbi:tRNA (adenosine(37)-N6)-threonylcarbamoyltransferase complex transferase subunit TsaD [Candidatus Roizmanbacteria bacterium]|nr:tRNA (adenosine(37)-N6)-threonylcarbamoyltransferase complex transferase subunit TsaD [Candidatus Roizmanbacteria bacterium]
MYILAIDTSADETAAAITSGRKILSYISYTQILQHREWGGIVPSIAKRAHEERIDFVVAEVCRKAARYIKPQGGELLKKIDYIAVTHGPGLAIALEVGIKKAKELAIKYEKKLISVNHMEGHIYSCFVQNSRGKPAGEFQFPYLALLLSGGHSEIVLFEDHLRYKKLGETRDDAAGEAIDKAARLLGFGYPGGPAIEKLAKEAGDKDDYKFPRPMIGTNTLEFSFSGLKTAFYYFFKSLPDEEKTKKVRELASSFQQAVLAVVLAKMVLAVEQTGVKNIVVGGGVSANHRLRSQLRALAKKVNGRIFFPPYPFLTGDNAAMIGVAAYYKAQANVFADLNLLDRIPRLSFA